MSILADKNTRLIVQGITGREGDFHARQMHAYSPILVGGVTPGKGGMKTDYGVPVFDTVGQAVREVQANASVIYVPAKFAPDAIMEAADAGIQLVVCITEGIPVVDMIKARAYLDTRPASPCSARTAPACSPPARPRSASSPRTLPHRAMWAWCRAAAR